MPVASGHSTSVRPLAPRSAAHNPWLVLAAALVLGAAIFLVYANVLSAPFVFDDSSAIVDNPSIRHLWPPGDALTPPTTAAGAVGRPIVNLSLALNYAIGGLEVRGYHLFNLALHFAAALTLFGLVRRTLVRPTVRDLFGADALWLAFGIALLWAVHPLLTESVASVIQRSELLGALFYLLTLYTFVRSVEDNASRGWAALSIAACVLGVAAKEIVATAPLVALLYDRTFVAGTFRAAWIRRRWFYAGLAGSWLLLALLMASNHDRGGTVGFGLGVSVWHYALTQCRALVLYLRLSLWPAPLVFDYGTSVAQTLGAVWWQAVLLVALLAGTVFALVRRPRVGFLAGGFFVILAPSSSFVPLATQTIAEHRMYLPLAAVVSLAVLGAYRLGQRWALAGVAALSLVAAAATVDRNFDYRSAIALWTDTVAKQPDNARAHVNLGNALALDRQVDAARAEFQRALDLEPRNAQACFGLANALVARGQFAAAVPLLRIALSVEPDYPLADYALGDCLVHLGQLDDGLAHYQRAAQHRPDDGDILHAYASALDFAGRDEAALAQYQAALRLAPHDVSLHQEIGMLLGRMGRPAEALPHLQTVVQREPGNTAIRFALAHVLLVTDRADEAAREFSTVVRAQPDVADAHNGLGLALAALHRWAEARAEFATALRLDPTLDEARQNLARMNAALNR
ncbi:tetratricopeptide repeat protein [Horticoccus luteus]|uniref:Tetratricopeptide repeat protein n=1 Tax=Horticoccus luteus TaxID=2862869 RepID=A0A8F9TUA4_9BACT|nr:tetratricopeptide repeat protein [Horticoccus luteus]QYM78141.1 tetratricopeptide repeat protein [Horticoccus luteus]